MNTDEILTLVQAANGPDRPSPRPKRKPAAAPKTNGHATEAFPDHGLQANAVRIARALNLEAKGVTVQQLVRSVELYECQVQAQTI